MLKRIALLTLLLALASQAYDRTAYGEGWPSLKNGCTVRTYEIAKHSTAPVTCKTLGNGQWVDPYTGKKITAASLMDIDHVVPLSEVDLSGGDKWSVELKKKYYSDTSGATLLPVSAHENRSKGDASVTKYLPPLVSYRATYCAMWYSVKKRYKLTATLDEVTVLKHYLGNAYKNDLKLRK